MLTHFKRHLDVILVIIAKIEVYWISSLDEIEKLRRVETIFHQIVDVSYMNLRHSHLVGVLLRCLQNFSEISSFVEVVPSEALLIVLLKLRFRVIVDQVG